MRMRNVHSSKRMRHHAGSTTFCPGTCHSVPVPLGCDPAGCAGTWRRWAASQTSTIGTRTATPSSSARQQHACCFQGSVLQLGLTRAVLRTTCHAPLCSCSQGRRADQINLLPGSTHSVAFHAQNPGTWLLHCHVNDHLMVRCGLALLL